MKADFQEVSFLFKKTHIFYLHGSKTMVYLQPQ